MGMISTTAKFLVFRAGSAALMAKKVTDSTERVRQLAARDCDHLRRTGTIERVAHAPLGPQAHRRSMLVVFLKGMLMGGLIVFLLSFLALMILTGMASNPASMATRLQGSLLMSSLLGLVGLVLPGGGLGVGGALAESKRRMDTAADASLRSYWAARESARLGLDAGVLSAHDAHLRLAPFAGVQQAPLSHQPVRADPPPTYYDSR